jgi:glycosyltransferase involved in cell wall biosynthesis
MSHYAQAIGASLAPYAQVIVLDGASGMGWADMWRQVRRLSRTGAWVLNTSPHWSVPLVVMSVPMRGGYVMHGPLLYLASRRTRPLYVAYYRFLARRLAVIVLHAERFRASVDALGLRPRRVVVVPHAFVPTALLDVGPYDPAGPFVCVGRMLPYKGVDVFVRALELLSAEDRPVPALIGGEGVSEDLVPATVPDLVVRPGHLTDAEFTDAIGRCAAVVLPYRKATQSGILATAFAAGRPVVATRVGSFPDYVDESNGILVPPDDPGALAAALDAIRRDPGLARRLAHGAKRTWKDRLDPDEAARGIFEGITS